MDVEFVLDGVVFVIDYVDIFVEGGVYGGFEEGVVVVELVVVDLGVVGVDFVWLLVCVIGGEVDVEVYFVCVFCLGDFECGVGWVVGIVVYGDVDVVGWEVFVVGDDLEIVGYEVDGFCFLGDWVWCGGVVCCFGVVVVIFFVVIEWF